MSFTKKLLSSAVVVVVIAYLFYKYQTTGQEGKLIKTQSGLVQGIISRSRDGREFYEWLKIPYAQPPVGSLRFATPKPIGEWEGVLDGRHYGPKCAQVELYSNFIWGQEDCLHLNIHVPKINSKKLLPVMYYIHGGAFSSMSAIDLKANYFMDFDVVLVTVNYRLGPLGFLSTGDKSIRGNMGLKDQVLGLEWIKNNVQSFGGDPDQITIFGESAGAVSVSLLMLSEKTRNLFQKAISLSGSALTTWGYTAPELAQVKAKSFAQDLNCPTTNSEELVDCLRCVDLSDILQTFKKDVANYPLLNPTKKGDMISPTVESVDDDEAFLTDYPYDLLVQGKAHKIPWLAGVLRDEGLLASLQFYRDDEAVSYFENNWEECIEYALSLSSLPKGRQQEFAKKLQEFYVPQMDQNGLSDNDKISQYTKMLSDGLFIAGTSEQAKILRKSSPVYLYFYNHTGGLTMANIMGEIKTRYPFLVETIIFGAKYLYNHYILGHPVRDYGVCHADDVHMMFPILKYVFEIPKNDQNPHYKFSKVFVKFLVSFATDEKSTEFRGKKLPAIAKQGPLKYLELRGEDLDPSKIKIIDEPFSERMTFWKQSLNFTQLFSSNRS